MGGKDTSKNVGEEYQPRKDVFFTHLKWTLEENKGYARFLEAQVMEVDKIISRKPRRFYLEMAEAVGGSRTN